MDQKTTLLGSYKAGQSWGWRGAIIGTAAAVYRPALGALLQPQVNRQIRQGRRQFFTRTSRVPALLCLTVHERAQGSILFHNSNCLSGETRLSFLFVCGGDPSIVPALFPRTKQILAGTYLFFPTKERLTGRHRQNVRWSGTFK